MVLLDHLSRIHIFVSMNLSKCHNLQEFVIIANQRYAARLIVNQSLQLAHGQADA